MPLLQTLATVQEEQSLGRLQELTSPVLSKVKEALIYTRLANAQQRAFGSRTVVLNLPAKNALGVLNRQLHIGWFEDSRLLILAFKNVDSLQCPKGDHKHDCHCQVLPSAPLARPEWLRGVVPEAEVHSTVLKLFDEFHDSGQDLATVMKSVTDGVPPRRITCVGYCVGGALATLAALFSALQYPTADIRCITFGAQLTGNAAFANAFRWLVGTSYRVVYRRDPVPGMKQKRSRLTGGLTHVHGEIYINDEQIRPGKQPHANHVDGDVEDHSLMRYAEAMHNICLAHFERDKAAGGDMYARFAACYLKLSGVNSNQYNPEKLHQDMKEHDEGSKVHHGTPKEISSAAVPSDQVPAVLGNYDFSEMHRLVNGAFKNTAAGQEVLAAAGSARAASTAHAAGTAPAPAPAHSSGASVMTDAADASPQNLSEAAILQRGELHMRAFFDRAMLGPPLPEPGAGPAEPLPHSEAMLKQPLPEHGAQAERGAIHTDSARSLYDPAHHDQHDNAMSYSIHFKPLQGSMQNDGATAAAMEAVDLTDANEQASDGTHSSVLHHGRSSSDMSTTTDFAPTLDTAGSDASPFAQASHNKGGSRRLKRTFSMVDQENVEVDTDQLDSLDQVLVTGKISQAVVLAAAAYRSEKEFQERTGITQSVLINDENHTNTHVHVGWLEGGTAVFAFRGTSTAQDGLQDVKIVRNTIDHLQEMFPGTQAHSGFLQQFAGVCSSDKPEKNMATVLQRLSGGKMPTRVLCCGHSLGGALATLGATWAALQYPQADIRCITFGSPRVGNKAFKRAFHTLVGTSLRLVHGGDPVPVLPPAFVYHHVDGAIHILRNKIKLRHRSWLFKLRPNVADHLVARYNAGIYMHMPGGLEEMPLPRPRNIKRLSSLQPSDITSASTPTSSRSILGMLSRLSPNSKHNHLGKESSQSQHSGCRRRLSKATSQLGSKSRSAESGSAEGEWCYASSGGKGVAAASAATGGAGRVLQAVTNTAAGLSSRAVQEAQDAAEVFGHRSTEDSHKSKRKLMSLNSKGSGSSSFRSDSGNWTMWHMFGCVAVQSDWKAESSSSDEDDQERVQAVQS